MKESWLEKGRMPASILRNRAGEEQMGEREIFTEKGELERFRAYAARLGWGLVWGGDFQLPYAFTWGPNPEERRRDIRARCELPPEVKEQLLGQPLSQGMRFTYQGLECYVIDLGGLAAVHLDQPITEEMFQWIQSVHAVETRFIDMNA
jgi:hypothetical protein